MMGITKAGNTIGRSMRVTCLLAVLWGCLPGLAAAATPAAPPAPAAVTYQVWGYRWDGGQYVKDAAHCLATGDLKQAVDYANEVNRFAGWTGNEQRAAGAARAQPIHTGRRRPPRTPAAAYAVWAFHLDDGKWVRSQEYSWTSPDPALASQYAQKVDAVAGWRALSNLPEPIAAPQLAESPALERCELVVGRLRDSDPHGRRRRADDRPALHVRAVAAGHGIERRVGGFQRHGRLVQRGQLQRHPGFAQSADSIATQDMINNQIMNDNTQNMLNTQNMIDTQNMVNNQLMNDNIQNMVNEQNMINSMNP